MKTCPICFWDYTGYPARCRWDSERDICPDCGTGQALLCMGLGASWRSLTVEQADGLLRQKYEELFSRSS